MSAGRGEGNLNKGPLAPRSPQSPAPICRVLAGVLECLDVFRMSLHSVSDPIPFQACILKTAFAAVGLTNRLYDLGKIKWQ